MDKGEQNKDNYEINYNKVSNKQQSLVVKKLLLDNYNTRSKSSDYDDMIVMIEHSN